MSRVIRQENVKRPLLVRFMGRQGYGEALALQDSLVAQRRRGEIDDTLLMLEHPPVVTRGRGSRSEHLLSNRDELRGKGVELFDCGRGGDVTYHGPGQVVAYPIIDLREWKRDVVAYVRALEQVMMDAAAEFGIEAGRVKGATGVWTGEAKLGAIGVHISRWVTSHGFALNVSTDIRYFGYIVPCGLHKPVTSIERLLGRAPEREAVISALVRSFGRVFGRAMDPVAGEPVARPPLANGPRANRTVRTT